ncbi:MAG: LamG domain-containing protein [Cellvibrionaceae bacterium]|nr:LamG domain-containing protein [Cellvibrionaceae bacterium]
MFTLLKPSAFLLCALSLLLITACSGGSGQQNVQNDDFSSGDVEDGIVYQGVAAATDDVTNFKVNLWDNLAGGNRCGACHNQEEGQQPLFLRTDDINLAYAAANNLVDLAVPSQSRLVAKTADGHNCWSSEASVCADIITNYIEGWASAAGASSNVIVLTAPEVSQVGASRSFPLTGSAEVSNGQSFASTVYPLLREHCASCHAEDAATQQQPYFGSSDMDIAYDASRSRIKLDDPANSRFVLRLGEEFHNCWSACSADASAMSSAIASFASGIEPTEIDPALQVSAAMSLADGIVVSSGGRIENNVIALYEFKSDSTDTAFDTSGVEPALDLNLSGDIERVGGWGIRINSGKAQAATSSSRKLYELIRSTGEYAVEAWVVPANVTQEGPARIVTYSGGSNLRNFTLGQTLYNYDFMNRSSNSDANAMPFFSTADDEEVLQATLQHVVANFDPINGSSIYVNGELVASDPDSVGANLNDWDDTFAFILGNEADDEYLWQGTIRFLAIHNRVLTAEHIVTNFDVGVGQKFYLLFSVSHHVNLPESYVAFQVEQFDSYSYLFNNPFFISLSDQTPSQDIVIRGIRLGVNGKELPTGQAFGNVDTVVNAGNYNRETGVPLSELGAVISLERGPDTDEFFLSFDQIGVSQYARVEPDPPAASAPADSPASAKIALRNFEEIGASIARVTTVPLSGANRELFESVYQQLPADENAEGFLAAHQSGVMQLAIGFCNILVSDTGLRAAYFPDFSFSGAVDSDNLDSLILPLLTSLAANEVTQNGSSVPLSTQPEVSDVRQQINTLINTSEMAAAPTEAKVTAVCASIVGSAVMLIQ